MTPLLHASARVLPRRVLALHLAGAVALLGATWSGLDDSRTALAVLRGLAVLLAASLALSVDEAAARLLDASPTALRRRLGARLAVCAAGVVPLWAGALALAEWRGAAVPAPALTLELAALCALGLAVPAALRRWKGVPEPAIVTGPLLLGTVLLASQLPRSVRLLVSTPLDPAWQAAHLRWALLLAVSAALLTVALADPATAGRPRRR